MEDGEGSITGAPDPGPRGIEPRATTEAFRTSGEPLATGPAPLVEPHPWFGMAAPGTTDQPLETCRFLASVDAEGTRLEPVGQVDPANVCLALGDPTPQSARQQELVCLAAAHRNCPRYLRGLLIEQTPPPPPVRQPISRPIVAASLMLVAALAASFGFLAVRGSLTVSLTSADSSQIAIVPAASIVAGPSPSPAPSARPSPTLSPTPSPSPSPSLTPGPTPSATPAATPTPTVAPTPRPSSDRYAVLTACPSTPDCWIYVVRPGDNLVSIAHWFGVSLERIYEMNPWARTTGLRAGQELRIPTPTR